MTIKKISVLLILFSFLSVSASYSKEPHDFIMDNIDSMKKELSLNDDQVKKIGNIMFESFRQIEEKHINVEENMIEIKRLLLKDEPDVAKIKTFIDKKSAVMAEIEFLMIKRDLSIKSVLTKEQFMKWRTLRKPEPDRFFNEPFFHPENDDNPFRDQNKEKQSPAKKR